MTFYDILQREVKVGDFVVTREIHGDSSSLTIRRVVKFTAKQVGLGQLNGEKPKSSWRKELMYRSGGDFVIVPEDDVLLYLLKK